MAKRRPLHLDVRRLLDERGLSQQWLADALGISPGALTNILSGRERASKELAAKLEEKTGFSARRFRTALPRISEPTTQEASSS